ncbi:MAG: DNA mismatch repair endonuclease MutL, partial [Chloroflexi bacterium]|nr:DNA mismatch repair endonuclease MutL [Chloroflexota bacterium]
MSDATSRTPRAIRPLPPELVSQIAAGEVVERPASVVKELIENALDAGAQRVEVRIQGAGQRLIEVTDDGHGIPAQELPLAVQRHATSKIATAEDLFRILSLGFRGEALAAIGSVARLTLRSRPRDADAGAQIVVEGGRIVRGPEPVAMPPGTQVRVEDLFYNVPARRKFLKRPGTEKRAIDEVVVRYALAYPQVRFKLTHDGRVALNTAGHGDRREVLALIYGPRDARQMLPVISEELGLAVHGFISPPGLTRSHRRDILFFVNGRPVRDPALTAALLKGYEHLLMKGRYPLAVLFLTLPADAVDVNVHPTKAEVRFREPDRVFRAVVRAVRKALLAHAPLAQRPAPLTEWDLARPAPGADEPLPWDAPRPTADETRA